MPSRSTTSRCPPSQIPRQPSSRARRCCTKNSAPTWLTAWSSHGGNVEEAFNRSDVQVVKGRFENPRVLPVPMETRGAAATFDHGTGELTFWASTQFPHSFRTMLAGILDAARDQACASSRRTWAAASGPRSNSPPKTC